MGDSSVPGVVLNDAGDGSIARLVSTVEQLCAGPLEGMALVGGLAVMARLASAHRATTDIDSVVAVRVDGGGDAIDALVAAGASKSGNGALFGGVQVDVIEAADPADISLDDIIDDDRSVAFVLAHAWALATAAPMEIVVVDPSGSQLLDATVRVATASALVAMKASAVMTRQGAFLAKRASDTYDLYRLMLLEASGQKVASQLAEAPEPLAKLCRGFIEGLFVTEPQRTSIMIAESAPDWAIDAERLKFVGGSFINRLDQATSS